MWIRTDWAVWGRIIRMGRVGAAVGGCLLRIRGMGMDWIMPTRDTTALCWGGLSHRILMSRALRSVYQKRGIGFRIRNPILSVTTIRPGSYRVGQQQSKTVTRFR